jgi:RNA-directed DNA polymerase
METLREAYALAKKNDGAPGIDGVTFEAIEAQGVEGFLEQIQDELIRRAYVPLPARSKGIPKDGGKVRVLSIPAIRDRVVQGALKLILEPIFEADFQAGSFGYRPKKTAHEAVERVAKAIVQCKTRVIDVDLRSYFDNIKQDRLLAKVAKRVDDADVMHLLKIILIDRQTRRSARRGYFTTAQQPLPHRGRSDAGAGQRGDPLRQVHLHRICAVCRRSGDLD